MREQDMSIERCIARVVDGMPASDGAGVRLKRVLGSPECEYIDPFLLLDEFRNDNPDDYVAGFPSHPHRGFETVTYMLHGKMRHEDSVGNSGLLTSGAVQWMTAGRGIIHSEMPEQTDGLLWGYQLWINLPAKLKMSPPRYQDISSNDIPEVTDEAMKVRVIAGRFGDVDGAAETLIPVTYLDVHLSAGTRFAHFVPEDHSVVAHVCDGALTGRDAADREVAVGDGRMAVFGGAGEVRLDAGKAGVRFLLIAGARLNEPVERMGPFVMNTRAELIEAAEDYRRGTLAQ